MEWRKEANDFIINMANKYFVERDMNVLQDHLQEHTSWIGTGKDELSRNLEEAYQALLQDSKEYRGTFQIKDIWCESVPVGEDVCIVYGAVSAVPNEEEISEEDIRFTTVLERIEGDIKLVHMHFSHADYMQEGGQFFVPRAALKDNTMLREALNARSMQLENLTRNIPGGAHECVHDAYLTLCSMSDGFISMFGYTREEIHELFQDQFVSMIYQGDRKDVLRTIQGQLRHGTDIEVECRVICKNGQTMWVLNKGRLMNDVCGRKCFYCILVEINERKKSQEELRLSLERHEVIMNQATDIIFEWDILNDTLHFSKNWRRKFGYDPIGKSISTFIPLSKNIWPDDIDAFIRIMKDTAAGVPYSEAEFRICDSKRRYIWCRIRATVQCDDNTRPIKAIGIISDIDREKKQKQELIEQAQRDPLTGLYNKTAMGALVEQRMQEVKEEFQQALMIMDVDKFKQVNDMYGHLCGDIVLSDVAAVLKHHMRTEDLAGRIGGDEFLVYLAEVKDEAEAYQKAEEFLTSLHVLTPETGAPPITCSMGVAVFRKGSADYQTLYQCADLALYHRKNNGRGGVTLYDPSLGSEEVTVRTNTEVDGELEGSMVDGRMAQYALRTLYGARDVESALQKLLEIIGRSYNVNRAYIFESSEDGIYCSNTFEWCAEGISPEIDHLQNLSYIEDLNDYQTNFNKHGLFYCADVREMKEKLRAVLEPQGICSMLQCAMLDDGEFVGYVGFDECETYRAWSPHQVESFKLTADVLSTFLVKLRQKQRLKGRDTIGNRSDS